MSSTHADTQDPHRALLLPATVCTKTVTSYKDQGDTQQRGFTSKCQRENEGAGCPLSHSVPAQG